MEIQKWIGIIAAIVSTAAYFPYAKAILTSKGQVHPNQASWIVWAVVDWSVFFSSIAAGVYQTAWVFLAFAVGSTFIAILSLRYGDSYWSKLDVFCLITSAVAFVMWKTTNTPETAIFLNIFVAIVGSIPTFTKSWSEPESEDKLTWAIFLVGGVLNVMAIKTFDWKDAAPPIAVALVQMAIVVLVSVRPRWNRAVGW